MPGCVQNCPTPKLNEATKPERTSSSRAAAARIVTNTGFTLPSSP